MKNIKSNATRQNTINAVNAKSAAHTAHKVPGVHGTKQNQYVNVKQKEIMRLIQQAGDNVAEALNIIEKVGDKFGVNVRFMRAKVNKVDRSNSHSHYSCGKINDVKEVGEVRGAFLTEVTLHELAEMVSKETRIKKMRALDVLETAFDLIEENELILDLGPINSGACIGGKQIHRTIQFGDVSEVDEFGEADEIDKVSLNRITLRELAEMVSEEIGIKRMCAICVLETAFNIMEERELILDLGTINSDKYAGEYANSEDDGYDKCDKDGEDDYDRINVDSDTYSDSDYSNAEEM